tara:strand:+ start:7430 stop:8101 length:672 start_codon:yes stop_codon:yes gene_type:complete
MLATSSAEAARPYSVSRYHGPAYASASVRYRNHSTRYRYSNSYGNSYARSYSSPYSTYYGSGARRYNYRYRPYAAVAGYRYYRPNYYRFNGYPALASRSYYGYGYGYNSAYSQPFGNCWNSYSSCYCSPFSGVNSSYIPSGGGYSFVPGSYAPYWGSYTPYWGSYAPNWGAYYGSPWSYYPGYFGNYYGTCGIWPYRPSLYGSIVFQSGFNTGYGRGSYYNFW